MYVDQIKDGYKNVDGYQRQAYGYTGWSVDTAKTNLWDQYTKGPMNSNPEKESSFMEVHISFMARCSCGTPCHAPCNLFQFV